MKIYCIGLGPGGSSEITPKALEFLKIADVIVGYGVYIDLIKHLIEGKEIVSTPMKKEVDRCRTAVELASKGKKVAVVSSGDSGIYGMASLIYELVEECGLNIEVETAAGITAASSAAAVLGAPLSNDFAVISLSDLLTPWELIEKRARHAIQGEFVICIYNPRSVKRADYLEKICKIAMEYIPENTWCGYVKNISRQGEIFGIVKLSELAGIDADMFTTIIIGNRFTRVINGRLVTPRGYKLSANGLIN